MKKFIILSILFVPLSLAAQWSYQLGIGRVLGTKDAFESVQLTDTLSFSYLKKGLNTTSAAFMATYRFNEKILIRTGIDGNKTTLDLRVNNSQNDVDIYIERRTFAEFHIPAEIQYEVSEGIFLNGGFSSNIRLERRLPIEERTTLEKVAYNSVRQISLNYRVGLTVKPIDWLGVDLMYDRPFASLVRPLKLEDDRAKPNFKYGTMTMRLTYFIGGKK